MLGACRSYGGRTSHPAWEIVARFPVCGSVEPGGREVYREEHRPHAFSHGLTSRSLNSSSSFFLWIASNDASARAGPMFPTMLDRMFWLVAVLFLR